jgi:hypothetical protein
MMTGEQLHQIFNALSEMLKLTEKEYRSIIPVKLAGGSEYTYVDQLRYDTRMYCWYLAAADGRLDVAETNLITQVLGENTTQNEMLNLMNAVGVASPQWRSKYEKGAVCSLGIAVCSDYFDENRGGKAQLTNLLLQYFTELGVALVSIDGVVTESEKEAVVKFVQEKVTAAGEMKKMLKNL